MKVLLVILMLLVLLLLLPVGGDFGYQDGTFLVRIRVGPVTVPILPAKPKREKSKKRKTRSETEKAPAERKSKGKSPADFLRIFSKEEWLKLMKAGFRNVKRLRYRLRRVKLHFSSAFADPYRTAMVYGYTSAAVCALGLDQRTDADIAISADFQEEHCSGEAYASVTIRVFYLLRFACSMLCCGLQILCARRRGKKIAGRAQTVGKER